MLDSVCILTGLLWCHNPMLTMDAGTVRKTNFPAPSSSWDSGQGDSREGREGPALRELALIS